MSLTDSLAAVVTAKKKALCCGVGKFLGVMSPPDKEALLGALSNPAYTASAIAKALREEGFQVSDFTLREHRRGSCNCSRNDA